MQPKIDYAITLWGYSCDRNIDKVQRMQNRAVRAICNNCDYILMSEELILWLKLSYSCKAQKGLIVSLLVFKSIHGLAPSYLNNEILISYL